MPTPPLPGTAGSISFRVAQQDDLDPAVLRRSEEEAGTTVSLAIGVLRQIDISSEKCDKRASFFLKSPEKVVHMHDLSQHPYFTRTPVIKAGLR